MPVAIPLVGALAAAAIPAALGIAGTLAGTLLGLVISTAFKFIGGALLGGGGKKGQEPEAPSPSERGRLIAAIQSDGPHVHIYGKSREAGTVTFRARKSKPDSNKNEFFFQIQTLAASECDGLEEIWVNNEPVEIDDDGWCLSFPFAQTDDATSKIVFTGQPTAGDTISLDGVAYEFVASAPSGNQILIGASTSETVDNAKDKLNSGMEPARIDDVGVSKVADDEATGKYGLILIWSGDGDQPDPPFALAANGANLSVTRDTLNGEFTSYLRFFGAGIGGGPGLGAPDQVAHPYLLEELPGVVDETFRGRGRCWIGFRAEFNSKAFPAGEPQVTAVLRGRKILDYRTGQTAWSDNAALCEADFLRADFGYGCPESEIDLPKVIAAANVCDEDVATLDGTEARYRCWMRVDTSQDRRATRVAIRTAMAGRDVFTGGRWLLYAGAYEPPTVSIDDGDMIGGITWTPRRSRRDLINIVRGTFVSPDHKWQPVAYPEIRDTASIADDNGDELVEVLDQAATPSSTQAQRIAWIALRGNRTQGIFEAPLSLAGLRIHACDGVFLSFARYAFVNRPMICTEWGLSTRDDDGHPLITITLQDDGPAVYEFSLADLRELPPLPTIQLPDDNVKPPPPPETVEADEAVTSAEQILE